MLEDMTFLKGSDFPALSWSRYSSDLMASSPRTAYSTLRIAGLSESGVRGIMVWFERRSDGDNNRELHLNISQSEGKTERRKGKTRKGAIYPHRIPAQILKSIVLVLDHARPILCLYETAQTEAVNIRT